MSSLEGEVLIERLSKQGCLEQIAALLASAPAADVMTTNNFAARCLAGKESVFPDFPWHLEPCLFLNEKLCTVYEARPFGCRGFLSQERCDLAGTAVVPPELLTLNTMMMQIIEHFDQGNFWGNMEDVLAAHLLDSHKKSGDRGHCLPRAEPLPGFLIPPSEQEFARRFLAALSRAGIGVGNSEQAK